MKVDKKTGEVLETNGNAFFKSQWDKKACFIKNVVYPPRITDSSQYEPIAELITKLKRGDGSVVRDTRYEIEGDENLDQAMDEMDITRTSGFDPVDANEVIGRGVQALKSVMKKSNVKEPDSKSPPAPPAKEGATGAANAPE